MAELVTLQVSNLCLPIKEAVTGGVDQHVGFLREVNRSAMALDLEGYDAGYEITPTRALMHSIAWNNLRGKSNGFYFADTSGTIERRPIWTSSHAAFPHFGSKYAIPLETERESFKSMKRLDAPHGSHLPKVVFADSRTRGGKLRDYREQGIDCAVAQLSPEVFETWQITLPGHYANIKDKMKAMGIQGIVADPFHVERSHRDIPGNKIDVKRLVNAIDTGKIPVSRGHLALGRTDFPNVADTAQSIDNLKALIDSPDAFAETMAGKFLGHCFDIWLDRHEADARDGTQLWGESFTMTTEITEAGFKAVQGHNDSFDRVGLPQKHAYLIKHTREFLAQVVRHGPQPY